MKMRMQWVPAVVFAAGTCVPVLAIQSQSTPPAPVAPPAAATAEPAPLADSVKGVVLAVQGDVQIGSTATKEWTKAEVGMEIPGGAEIRTGFRSVVQIGIAGTQLITIDRFSTIKLSQLVREEGVTTTELGVKYGRVLFDVDSTKFANKVTIKAPDTTLAVRGTTGGIEYTRGHPTLAFGSNNNTGRIEVAYGNGRNSQFADNSRTSAANPDPAANWDSSAFIDSADGASRDEGEISATNRSPGGGGLGGGFIDSGFEGTGAFPGATPFDWLAVADIESGLIQRRSLLNGKVSFLADSPVEYSIGGMAIQTTESKGGKGQDAGRLTFNLFLLEGGEAAEGSKNPSMAFNELYVADVTGNSRGGNQSTDPEFTLLARFSDGKQGEGVEGGDVLSGLGIVDGEFYATKLASGFESTLDTIVRLDIENQTTHDVMNFGQGFATRTLSGAEERGSLFIVGSLQGEGLGNSPFARLAVLEFDPRNSYVSDSFSGLSGDFRPREGTSVNGIDATLFSSDSVDVQGATFARGRLVLAIEGSNGEKGTRSTAIIQLDPNARGNARSPFIKQINGGRNRGVTGIAAAPRGRAPGPVILSNPEGAIDTTTINAQFASLAYSEKALRSGALQHMVGQEIINTSVDPSGCATSTLISMIPGAMLEHANQTSGIGRAVAQLRDNLPDGHPCISGQGRRHR